MNKNIFKKFNLKDVISKVNSINENEWLTKNSFLLAVAMVIFYLLVPQLVGSLLYYRFKMDEMVAVIIGNSVVLVTYVLVFLPTLKMHAKKYFTNFKKNFRQSLKYWGIGLIIMMISNIIINFYIMDGNIATNEELNRQMLLNYKSIAFFEAVIVATFVEEMIFRFALRKSWGKNKYFPLVSGLIFGFVHTLAGLTSGSLLNLLYIIPYGALGYMFGLLYNKTDSIFSSLSVHMLHNFICYGAIVMIL